jgi:hypothetical protein
MWWYSQNGVEIEYSNNAIKLVNASKVILDPLDSVELSDVSFWVEPCQNGNFTGERDKAIIFT